MIGGDPSSSSALQLKGSVEHNTVNYAPAREAPRAPPPDGLTAPPFPANHGGERRNFRAFKRWFPWLVPSFVVANVALFVITMYENDCPKHSLVGGSCFAPFLGRFSFQPLKENPLFGPSSST